MQHWITGSPSRCKSGCEEEFLFWQSGNFSTIAIQCLQKLPDKDSRFTFTCDRHTFNFVVDNGYTYLAVADEEFGRQVYDLTKSIFRMTCTEKKLIQYDWECLLQIPFAFLEKIKGEFSRKFGMTARTAVAHSLQDEFG